LNAFDILLVVLLGLLVTVGGIKGLARLLIGLGALVAAFVIAAQFHQALAARLGFLQLPEAVVKLIAYVAILVGTMLGGVLLAFLTRKLLKAAMLGWVDRLAGAALGLVAALTLAALLVLPAVAYSTAGQTALRSSRLAPYVTAVSDLATRLVPADLSRRYREGMEALRRYWRDRSGAAHQARRLDGPTAG